MKKNGIIFAVACVLILGISFGGYAFYNHQQEQKAEEAAAKKLKKREADYKERLSTFPVGVINAMTYAEKVGDSYLDVWQKAVFEDSVTIEGKDYSDFNDALLAQTKLLASEGTIEDAESAKSILALSYSNLKTDIPAKYEEDFKTIKALYNSSMDYINLALSPTGSYQTYSEATSDKKTDALSDYEKAVTEFQPISE
ncbi:hypothetical protein HB904_09320 [Listeria booriae]|uniref:Uncharacterized protein n=1 Tax=Listeria booriae TaxID=1552123 RepID=A0A842AK84_9LIST|nr:hypothetical protein [Listeria booriae]MBC1616388.1 hypothetical protein [Listeria booriae]